MLSLEILLTGKSISFRKMFLKRYLRRSKISTVNTNHYSIQLGRWKAVITRNEQTSLLEGEPVIVQSGREVTLDQIDDALAVLAGLRQEMTK
jgi:uncharacterized cupin superfamily protein